MTVTAGQFDVARGMLDFVNAREREEAEHDILGDS